MYKVFLQLPANLSTVDVAILNESMGDLCTAHSALRTENNESAPWILEWLFDTQAEERVLSGRIETTAKIHGIDLPKILNFQNEDVPDRDWLAYSYRQFPPFSVGPFFIYGAHYNDGVPDGQMGLQIDPIAPAAVTA